MTGAPVSESGSAISHFVSAIQRELMFQPTSVKNAAKGSDSIGKVAKSAPATVAAIEDMI